MTATGSDAKPSILIYGNCQGEHVGHVAHYLPSLRERYNVKVISLHLVTQRDWDTRFNEAFFADVRVVWNQVESGEPTANRQIMESRIPVGCQVIKYPPLSVLCLWPFSGADSRLATRTRVFYPWPDSIAASLAGEDLPDDELFAAYMRLSTEKMPNLERRLRIDATRAATTDAMADIKMWEWVEANLRTRNLFHSSSHLTALPVGQLLKELLARTEGLTEADIRRLRQETDFLLRHYRGQDVEMVPIHPLVAERLGLAWYNPNQIHRFNGHEWTYKEYIVKYIRWEPFLN